MDFQTRLNNYADLIVRHGLNVQTNQTVNIICEIYHRELAHLISEAAYKVGASFVNIDFVEPRIARTRIIHSNPENLSYVPQYFSKKFEEFVENASDGLQLSFTTQLVVCCLFRQCFAEHCHEFADIILEIFVSIG